MQLVSNEHRKRIKFQICSESAILLDAHPDYRGPVFESIMQQFGGEYNQTVKAWVFDRHQYQPLLEKVQDYLSDLKVAHKLVVDPIPEFVERYLRPVGESITFKHQTETQGIQNHTIEYEMIKEARRGIDTLPLEMLQSLYAFQKEGIEFGIKRFGRLLIGDDMGVGKSIQALGLCCVYKDEWPVLIICPSSLKLIWKREIARWLSKKIKDRDTDQQKVWFEPVQIINAASDKLNTKASFYIISVDLAKSMLHILLLRQFKVIICDEAHYLKNMETKRCKGIVPLMRLARRVFLLTGTPALAKPKELFPLLSTIRPDLFQSFREFGKRYCNPQTSRFTKQVEYDGHDNIEELNFVLRQYMIRRLKKDVLTELPSKTRQVIEIRPSNKELKEVKNLIQEISNGGLKMGNVLERLSGESNVRTNIDVLREAPKEKGDATKMLHLATKCFELTAQCKLEAVCEFLRDLDEYDQKLVIFAHHTIMIDGLESFFKKLGKGYIRIDGRVDPNERGRLVEKYQTNEQIKYAILGITSCSTGFTLTTSSTVIFAELHWTPANIIQAEDRCHRIGQKSNVTVYYLLAQETLDSDIFRLIKTKFETTSRFLDGEKAQLLHVEGANTNRDREVKKVVVEPDQLEVEQAHDFMHEMEEAMVDPNGNPIIAESQNQQRTVELRSSDPHFSEETQNRLKQAIENAQSAEVDYNDAKKTFGYGGEAQNTARAAPVPYAKPISQLNQNSVSGSTVADDQAYAPQSKTFGYGSVSTINPEPEPSQKPGVQSGINALTTEKSSNNLHQTFRQSTSTAPSATNPINLSSGDPAQYYASRDTQGGFKYSESSKPDYATSYNLSGQSHRHAHVPPQRATPPPRKEINVYGPPRSPPPLPQAAATKPVQNQATPSVPAVTTAKPPVFPMAQAPYMPNSLQFSLLQRQYLVQQTQQAFSTSTSSRRPVRMAEQPHPLPPIEHTFDLSGYLPQFVLMSSKGMASDFYGKLPATSDGFGNYPYGSNTTSVAIGDRLRGFPTMYAGSKYRGEEKPALAAVQQKLRELNSTPDTTLLTKGISGPVGEITFVPKSEEEIREAKDGSAKKKKGRKSKDTFDGPLILEASSVKEHALTSQQGKSTIVPEPAAPTSIFAQARKPMPGVTLTPAAITAVSAPTTVNPLLSTFSTPATAAQSTTQPPLPNTFKPQTSMPTHPMGFGSMGMEPPRPGYGLPMQPTFSNNSAARPTTEQQFSTSTGNPVVQIPAFGLPQGMGFPSQFMPYMMGQFMPRPQASFGMAPATGFPMMPFGGMDPQQAMMQGTAFNSFPPQMLMQMQMMQQMATMGQHPPSTGR